ncbi:MAG: glycerol kinase GlpK [Ruminococcaceae bacterium]|nr:glycerol kinase GlpK [Oscillospiraceae bacterium]
MSLILALDQGTTSSRAILFDEMEPVYTSQHEYTQCYPKSGWVEHVPGEIVESQLLCVKEALDFAGERKIDAIGITNQRETTIVWDRNTGLPVYNAIVWQCRRTFDFCAHLKNGGYEELIREKTGLPIDPYFSASKIKWILDNVDGARERAERGELLFGTVDTWLIWNLTGGRVHATDVSNASRTQLFNINTMEWDDELLSLFTVPRSMLPKVLSSSDDYGSAEIYGRTIPIMGVAGDQQSALFGQSCFSVGESKNTYGTGAFLLTNIGDKPIKEKNGLITTVAWRLGDKVTYALEGSVFCAGSVIKWLRDGLGLIQSSSETEEIARSVQDNGGVYIVPAFTGLGAPYWDSEARGVICGLTAGATKAHIVRSALESIAYQVNDLINLIRDAEVPITRLCVDGGASANDFLLEFQSGISDIVIVRRSSVEATARGAALLADMGLKGIDSPVYDTDEEGKAYFTPSMAAEKREEYTSAWKKAVERTLS